MVSTISRVKVAGVPDTPMSAVGWSAVTASASEAIGACSWAYGSLCEAR